MSKSAYVALKLITHRFSGVQYFWQRVFYWQRLLQVHENCFKINFKFAVEISADWIQNNFQKK
jgi:hypothetical protein